MLLLVGSGLVFFPSDEPEGEGLHTVIAHCTVQASNANGAPNRATGGSCR